MAGASRFAQWLDDMPTVGWGYGALTGNRTKDFLALLYGHMATYQVRQIHVSRYMPLLLGGIPVVVCMCVTLLRVSTDKCTTQSVNPHYFHLMFTMSVLSRGNSSWF